MFEIQKPYFNFDTNNVDGQLGVQRARGVELSLSGEVLANLNVAVGALLGEVKIIGSTLAAEGVGTTAFGQPHSQGSVNANYKFPWLQALSADITFLEFGTSPQALMMSHRVPQKRGSPWVAVTGSSCGCSGNAARAGPNATNFYFWNMGYSPGFSQLQPRAYFGYLTADL